jgi:hypothetical protein
VDLEDGRHRVLDVCQLEGQLLLPGEGADRGEGGVDVLLDGLTGPQELEEDLQLFLLLLQKPVVRENRLGPLELPKRLLRRDVVGPEVLGA